MSNYLYQLIRSIGIAIMVVSCSKSPTSQVAPSPGSVVTPTTLPAPKDVWMTEFQQINGTPYFYAPIYVASEEQKNILKEIKKEVSSLSGYDDRQYSIDIRNYIFVHRDDLSASKLLPSNSSRLLNMEKIGEASPPDKSASSSPKKVQALWYIKVSADTNGDNVLNDKDRKQIAISDTSGANYAEVVKDIDKILLVSPKGLDRRLVIYTSGNKRFVADVDILKRQATVKELPTIN
jgi:hypothetical protein